MKRIVALALALAAGPALADEGMWTYDNFPSAKVQEAYGFAPTRAWLDEARLASARLANGCSASFVSPEGLVLTNHHCVHACVEHLSTAERDLVERGYLARSRAEELRCPAMEVNQLAKITDVTDRIARATKGKEGKAYAEALQAEIARLEKGCAKSDRVRCDVVTLYGGGQYHLYEYRRFQDVRLVFAPELASAFFGGDPDNFTFPRYNFDVAFLRVWEDGKPAKTRNWFRWSEKGAQEGELVFVSGHPGRTSRLLTVSQLEFERDVALPERLLYLAELRGILLEFGRRGPEQKRIALTDLFAVENSLKALRGRHEALLDPALFGQLAGRERELRRWVEQEPERKAAWGTAWDEIAEAQGRLRNLYDEYLYAEGTGRVLRQPRGIMGDLFALARGLVRAAEERSKPDEKRLREFTDANLPALEAQLFSEAPIYPELEYVKLSFSLRKLREELGTDHPFVRKVLGKHAPEDLARQLVEGTKLADVSFRRSLYAGGAEAIAASTDPMIVLARTVDPDARAVRARYEQEVDAVQQRAGQQIARARFAALGTSTYPDATFTLRLSYGAVEGYEEKGERIAPITRVAGLYERATGSDPYALPPSWLRAKEKLDLDTPMNFASTNDIIGGNSGSPVINRNHEIVGLVFDGNIQSLGGEYGFDPATNRAVSVHSQVILEALDKVYGADSLLQEIRRARH